MWFFRKKTAGEKIRNPIQGEFFATDAITGPCQALVRESVQNSLDAREKAGTPVRVEFTLMAGTAAAKPERVEAFFRGIWPHYAAVGNGLRDAPASEDSCCFLVVEDFGTRGLTGNPLQADPDPDPLVRNAFFTFFRAEGLSGKSGLELGRWGVGKFVFPRSSRANTHFGLTVRHDDNRTLLMGAATLKAHRVQGYPDLYTPDGLYGTPDRDGFVAPIEDAAVIHQFRQLFQLRRGLEPGLSVVVPFVDPAFSTEALLSAAISDYFHPILHGDLVITINGSGAPVRLDRHTLSTVIEECRAQLAPGIPETVQLSQLAEAVTDAKRIVLSRQETGAPKWTDEAISKEIATTIREKLDGGEVAAVRVPVKVRPKTGLEEWSHFDIYMRHQAGCLDRPVVIREGIIIADARAKKARDIRALIAVEHRALAGLLGDAENPAHTQWQKDSSNFRGRYTYGPSIIDFVSNAVGELVAIINRSSTEKDTSLTSDIFSIARPDAPDKKNPTPKPTPAKPPQVPEIKPSQPRVAIDRIVGGFTVTCPVGLQYPATVKISCAYDTGAGNPLGKWSEFDFVLGEAPISIEATGGASVLQLEQNLLVFSAASAESRVRVTGFDERRDLYLKVQQQSRGEDGDAPT